MSIHQQKSRDLVRLYYQRRQNGVIANTKNPYAIPGALDIWTKQFDNLFAKTVFGTLDSDEFKRLAPMYPILTPLCQNCSHTETGTFSGGSFVVSYERAQASRAMCSLCAVIYMAMNHTTGEDRYKMVLREGSSLTLGRGEPPLLSLVIGPSPGKLWVLLLRITTDTENRPQSVSGYLPERLASFTGPWKFYPGQIAEEVDQMVRSLSRMQTDKSNYASQTGRVVSKRKSR